MAYFSHKWVLYFVNNACANISHQLSAGTAERHSDAAGMVKTNWIEFRVHPFVGKIKNNQIFTWAKPKPQVIKNPPPPKKKKKKVGSSRKLFFENVLFILIGRKPLFASPQTKTTFPVVITPHYPIRCSKLFILVWEPRADGDGMHWRVTVQTQD